MPEILELVLWLALFWVILTWALLATARYQRLYGEVHGIRLQPPQDRYLNEPLRFFSEAPSTTVRALKAFWERQENPEVETARRRAVRRLFLLIAYFVVSPLLLVLCEVIGK